MKGPKLFKIYIHFILLQNQFKCQIRKNKTPASMEIMVIINEAMLEEVRTRQGRGVSLEGTKFFSI